MQPLKYSTRSLYGDRFWMEFVVMVTVFMASLQLLTMLQLPEIAVGLISFAILVLYTATRTATAVYTLDEKGIKQELTPLLGKKPMLTRFFPWNQIKWYQDGTELSRGGAEYHYLKIGFLNSRAVWHLTTLKGDPDSFRNFVEAFLSQVPASRDDNSEHAKLTTEAQGRTLYVQRRKSIYESIWGKIIAILFVGITIGLFALVYKMGIENASYLFRLAFIIIPGTAYLVYRSFIKRK